MVTGSPEDDDAVTGASARRNVALGHLAFNVCSMMGAWTYYAFVADPHFAQHFAAYAGGHDGSASPPWEPAHPELWTNVMNSMSLARVWGNSIAQIGLLFPAARSLAKPPQIFVGIACSSVVFVVPVAVLATQRTGEVAAFASLVGSVFLGGVAAGFQQPALYGLGGYFSEHSFAQGSMMGQSAAAGLTSIIKVVVKASFGDGSAAEVHESLLYFSLGVVTTAVAAVVFTAFSRSPMMRTKLAELTAKGPSDSPEKSQEGGTAGDAINVTERAPLLDGRQQEDAGEDSSAVLLAATDTPPSKPPSLRHVLYATRWTLLSIGLIFVATFAVYPGLLVRGDPSSAWFKVLAMLSMNVMLFVGRFAARPLIGFRDGVVVTYTRTLAACCLVRLLVFVPLFVFAFPDRPSRRGYVYPAAALFQLSGGVLSAIAAVAMPRSPELNADPAAKALAGQITPLVTLVAVQTGTGINFGLCRAVD